MKTRMNRDERIRREYFLWLCNLIMKPGRIGLEFLWSLHQVEFYWTVPNDDNRLHDGTNLREYFIDSVFSNYYSSLDGPCSILEMLVALSQRMDFQMSEIGASDNPGRWFWELIDNLNLEEFSDNSSKNECRQKAAINQEKLKIFMDRSYSRSGHGGLFPLKKPNKDQRKVEIWYQMMAYLMEKYPN